MRSSRLLSILMILQSRGRVTAEALAAEFEVSVRTIYRDIDALAATGAPVYAERGRAGGFQLLDGYRTRLTGLTDAEAETLFLGGVAGAAAQMGLREAMAMAQLKLLAALPPERQQAAERIAARFHLDPVGWYRDAEEASRLPAIAQAVWNTRVIELDYESWKGRVGRRVDPLGLILKAGAWYLAGRVGRTVRTYRLSNVLALTVTEETFERPLRFDLAAWWAEASERFETELYTGEAVVRLSSTGLKRLRHLGSAMMRAADGAPAPGQDGWTMLTVPIESIEHASLELFRLGPDCEVLGPPALRELVAGRVRRMAALYA